jgi:peptidyl-prolyl cis-trans isomerase C
MQPTITARTGIALQMGFFDNISKAFSNAEYSAPPEGVKATARHILVKDKKQIGLIMNELKSGATFNQVAKAFSTCSSASSGGSLGSFPPGRMVKEFDEVIFDPKTNIGEVIGPVQTQFGYHMIVVEKRTGV